MDSVLRYPKRNTTPKVTEGSARVLQSLVRPELESQERKSKEKGPRATMGNSAKTVKAWRVEA